jgi:hypothetical protein
MAKKSVAKTSTLEHFDKMSLGDMGVKPDAGNATEIKVKCVHCEGENLFKVVPITEHNFFTGTFLHECKDCGERQYS